MAIVGALHSAYCAPRGSKKAAHKKD